MKEGKWTIVAIVAAAGLVGWYMWDKVQQARTAEATAELVRAAADGNVEQARELIDEGADVNGADPNGITPLQAAVGCRQTEMANFLLEQGADPQTAQGKPAATRRRSYG